MELHRVFNPEKQRAEFTEGSFEKLVLRYPRLSREIADEILNECNLMVESPEPIRLPNGQPYRQMADYFLKLDEKYLEYGLASDGQEYEYLKLWCDDEGVIFNYKDIE